MTPKLFLLLMTITAVISDSMLHPFYPQYLADVYGVSDSMHVGWYIAACSLTVLLTFPLWALCSKRVNVVQLLIATQVVTGALSLACSNVTSLTAFWVISLVMMAFKASYLLIYPYVMAIESKEQHVGTISLLAFVVYFGNLLAALLGGWVFQALNPRAMFVAMAIGDLLQILLCVAFAYAPAPTRPRLEVEAEPPSGARPPPRFVYKLGAVMLLMYFSADVIEPFFSTYWERVSTLPSKVVSGFVFAIPGLAALAGLYVNARARPPSSPSTGIVSAIALAAGSLGLQASGNVPLVLLGRCLFGWALFQAMVRLDALLFQLSAATDYSLEFSKVHLFQGLGVLLASLAAGALVTRLGMTLVFVVSAAGFLVSAVLYKTLLRDGARAESSPSAGAAIPKKGVAW